MSANNIFGPWTRLHRALWRRVITLGIQPMMSGQQTLLQASNAAPSHIVYVQATRSIADTLIVEKAVAALRKADQSEGPNSPLQPLKTTHWYSAQSYIALAQSVGGRVTMRTTPALLTHLMQAPSSIHEQVTVVPVCVFWGRALAAKDSFLRALTSDQRSATAGLKRLLGLIFNRGDVHVCFGKPIALAELAKHERGAEFAARRAARLMRLRFKTMQFVTLGPDHSHRRTLLDQVASAPRVRKAIDAIDAAADTRKSDRRQRLNRQALRMARTIASDLTYSTIRLFLIFLSWFWRRIYDGVEVQGLDDLRSLNDTHTLVYVPTHRSHIDYLVLSYSLYTQGIMLPIIAAGDNLNMPVLGRLLRQGGAFFMRRSFRDDALYSAVFEEYVYQVLAAGHSVEFFPEGGRSRSGRLLPPKYGLLKLCLEHQQRGLEKPLAFVPIYFGYEKVVEGGSYLRELRGSAKQKERLTDLISNAKVVRQRFGMLQVNLADAIKLDSWLEQDGINNLDQPRQLERLGQDIMLGINRRASVNPINLVALAITQRTHLTMQEQSLTARIGCYRDLAISLYGEQILTANVGDAAAVIERAETLDFVSRHKAEAWVTCSADAATLLTWYRNNVLHLFAAPALIALLVSRSSAGLTANQLAEQAQLIYPFIAKELTTAQCFDLGTLLHALEQQQLIVREGPIILPPTKQSEANALLNQLSGLVLEMLQRMYVVISIATVHAVTRTELKRQSQAAAKKLSRLFGLTGAEFSEERLLDAFVEQLLEAKLMSMDAQQQLVASPLLQQVAEQAAEQIIEPPVHLALQRVIGSSASA
ncbi:MAG: glycerol-3-phosphate 1-O-acyltransferase PlsB [Proteobacteria bacterium]|nr:glycerol-3-phosphate 1-O-acyltransferase PlsB [Pseudomonadota bacterium]